MFKKKEKIKEENLEPTQAVEQKQAEEELIDKEIPNPQVAVAIIRDVIRDEVMCICNIPKQHRHDIGTCMSYLYDYINEPIEFRLSSSLQEQINEGTLENYTKTYKDNSYEISLTIKKVSKK